MGFKRTVEALQLATEYFEQAIERDPDYAPGWTGIAECQTMLGHPEYCNLSPRQTMPRAKKAVARALELAPALPEAHLWSGVVALLYDWDWVASEQSFRKSLRLRPIYSLGEAWYSMLLSALGRHEEALLRAERASELDPLALLIQLTTGRAFYFAGRQDEALLTIRATAEMEPGHPLVRIWLGRVLLALGRCDEALKALEGSVRVAALEGYIDCLRATALIRLGQKRLSLVTRRHRGPIWWAPAPARRMGSPHLNVVGKSGSATCPGSPGTRSVILCGGATRASAPFWKRWACLLSQRYGRRPSRAIPQRHTAKTVTSRVD